VPVLIKAIQEQDAKIADLTAKIESLETQTTKSNAPYSSVADEEQSSLQNDQKTNILYQNAPNPFNATTTIRYSIAQNADNAKICIYNLNGLQLKCFNLTGAGEGTVQVQASDLKAGMYLYSLLVNNQIIDTKRMVLTE
jgi:hypothetical protein